MNMKEFINSVFETEDLHKEDELDSIVEPTTTDIPPILQGDYWNTNPDSWRWAWPINTTGPSTFITPKIKALKIKLGILLYFKDVYGETQYAIVKDNNDEILFKSTNNLIKLLIDLEIID